MTTADYDFGDTLHTPIEKLKAIVKADETKGVPRDYGWLKDILDETLEHYTISKLTKKAANTDASNPLQVEAHLAEGSRLLDLCLNQRKEIYQLESQAILSALDICLSQQTLNFDQKIAQINLAAMVKQAQLPPEDGNADLHNKYETYRNALTERLRLHNRPGSSLNYGARVKFMREIYVDNLRLAYQRLHAAWRGAAFAYRIKTTEPEYIPKDRDVLDSYVMWMRNLITLVEQSDTHERVYDVQLPLDSLGLDMELRRRLDNDDHIDTKYEGEFVLTPSYLGNTFDFVNDRPEDTDAVRLLGIDIAFTFKNNDKNWVSLLKDLNETIARETPTSLANQKNLLAYVSEYVRRERESISMTVQLTPPCATTQLDGKEYRWQPAALHIENAPAWTERSSRNHFRPLSDPSFQNASPYGKWTYVITQICNGSDRYGRFGDLAPELEISRYIVNQEFRIKDIILYLRVAVRKSQHKSP